MTIPLLSAFYFGTVEHYRLLARCEKAVIDIGEHYERQSYRTRTGIMGPNGRQDLLVNIDRRSGEKMPMRTVGLSYTEHWHQQHVHAIRSAYGQTPWFIHYIDDIEQLLLQKHERLVDLDLATMRLGLEWLGLRTEVMVSEEYVETGLRSKVFDPRPDQSGPGPKTSDLGPTIDLRTTLHPKRPLPAEVEPVPSYPQVFADRHGAMARLSVIDLVMNTGPQAAVLLRQ
ncbi:MAG TPA: WbqC family protein [Flavobacteriales bacterium]